MKKFVIATIFVFIVIWVEYFFFSSLINDLKISKEYIQTNAKIINYAALPKNESRVYTRSHQVNNLYYPIIEFEVEGKTYTVQLKKYEVPIKPVIGDTLEVRYNKSDPNKVVDKYNISNILGLFAIQMFVFIPIIMIVSMTEAIKESKTNIGFKIAIGFLLFMGVGIYCCLSIIMKSFNPIKLVPKEPWILIPLLLIAVPVLLIVNNLIIKVKKNKIVEFILEKIEVISQEKDKHRCIFRRKNGLGKYLYVYFYETKDMDKFVEGNSYMIDIYKIQKEMEGVYDFDMEAKKRGRKYYVKAIDISKLKIEDIKSIDEL